MGKRAHFSWPAFILRLGVPFLWWKPLVAHVLLHRGNAGSWRGAECFRWWWVDSREDKQVHPTEMLGRAKPRWVLLSSFFLKGDQTNLTVLHSSTPLYAVYHSSRGKSITPLPEDFSSTEGKKGKFLDTVCPTRIAAPLLPMGWLHIPNRP